LYQQECYQSYYSTASGRRWYTLSRALSCDTDDLRTQDPHTHRRAPKARSTCPQTCKIAPKSLSQSGAALEASRVASMRHSRSSHRVSEAPQTGHAVCDAHVSHPSQPARHLADSAQNARARALPRDERMPAELRGRGYRVSPLSPPLASCDPAPVADMTKRVPKRTCARRAHGAATQRTHPALIKSTPSLASAMCVAHRKAPLAFLCSPAVSVLGRGTRIPERDLCARLHSGSVNRDQSQYGESQEAEASPRPPRPPRRRGRHASEARRRSRRRALAPCRRHVLPQAAGGCQVLAPPLVRG